MSYSDTTPNLNLPQWDDQDEWDVADLNEGFSKIDEQMDYSQTPLTLGANWSNQSVGTFDYLSVRKIAPNAALLNGVIKSNTAKDTSVIATVPSKYLPAVRGYAVVANLSTWETEILRINEDGTIYFQDPSFNANAILAIQNVVFRI